MDALSAAQQPTVAEAACQYVSLDRCEASQLAELAPAGAPRLLLADTTRFKLGRYIRINPGAINEEDSRIVGFGQRLRGSDEAALSLATARNAAENAKEQTQENSAAATAPAHAADADAPVEVDAAADAHRPAHHRAAMAFVQLASRASALLPPTVLRQISSAAKRVGGRAEPPPATVKLVSHNEGKADGDLPFDKSDRVHGRALHRQLDLEQTLRFAHHGGERVIMLPESTTRIRAAPAMTHSGARDFLVHRQYELAPPPSPPFESAAERRARLSKPSPPPSPPSPPNVPPPEKHGYVADDMGYRYDGEEAAAVAMWAGVLSLLCCCVLLVVCLVVRSRVKRRRRRAQLEDVQSVFHTETWRKVSSRPGATAHEHSPLRSTQPPCIAQAAHRAQARPPSTAP